MTTYKYFIPIGDLVRIELPEGSKLLHIGAQGPGIYAWFLVLPENPDTERIFRVYGTGHYIEQSWEHRGTVQIGEFVWHVFEDVG